ncbi:MAG: PAS-domain containing protein, partial [Pseudomonadota bacterium]
MARNHNNLAFAAQNAPATPSQNKALSSLSRINSQSTNQLLDQMGWLDVLVDNFPGGIALFDRDLNMVVCNDALKHLLDYPDALFAHGMPNMEDLFRFNAAREEHGPGDIDEKVAAKLALVRQRQPHRYQRTRQNGTVLEVRGAPVDGGGFVTTYLDVTDQQRRLTHLEVLLDNFPGGISVFDRHLQMVLCNDELKRLLDYPEEMFAGRLPTMEELFRFNAERGEYGAGDVETIVADKLALVDLSATHHYERERPDGTVLEVRGVPLEGGGFVTTYLDVTDQRQRVRRHKSAALK